MTSSIAFALFAALGSICAVLWTLRKSAGSRAFLSGSMATFMLAMAVIVAQLIPHGPVGTVTVGLFLAAAIWLFVLEVRASSGTPSQRG